MLIAMPASNRECGRLGSDTITPSADKDHIIKERLTFLPDLGGAAALTFAFERNKRQSRLAHARQEANLADLAT